MSSSSAPPEEAAPKSVAPLSRAPLIRRLVKPILALYLRPFHRVEFLGRENLPVRGPALVIVNHASLLDVPTLMLLDPFPNTATVVKASMFEVPLIGWVLRHWGAIPVEREGRDSASLRRMLGVLRSGGVLAVAGEGRRTRSGRLEPINPVLARLAVNADVPIVPVALSGSFRALPPGAWLPRPTRITVRAGPPFRLARGTSAEAAAARIRRALAEQLPPELQPLPDEPAARPTDEAAPRPTAQ